MKVIFLHNVRGVGQIGDVKDVADGYARNYLLPHKFAKLANQASIKEAEALKAKREILVGQEQTLAQEAVERLEDMTLKLSGRANEQGTLFAAIPAKEVARRITQETGVVIEPDMIVLEEHNLKKIGEHTIAVRFPHDIQAQIKVVVHEE